MTPAIKLLDQRRTPHRVVSYDHDPDAASYGSEAAEALGLDPSVVYKTLLADLEGGETVVAVVPVTGRLNLKALARAAGAKRASMTDPAAAERLTGYVVGGISPLGQRRRLRTFIDATAADLDEVHVSGGRRGLEIAIAPDALTDLLEATVGHITDSNPADSNPADSTAHRPADSTACRPAGHRAGRTAGRTAEAQNR